jgi:hypothetical protein
VSAFVFQPEPVASELVGRALEEFCVRSASASALGRRLRDEAGVRLSDGVELMSFQADAELRRRLASAGFAPLDGARRIDGVELWEHAGGLFPLFELRGETKRRLFLRVESVVDFLESAGHEQPLALEGNPGAFVRRALLATTSDTELWVAERWTERRLLASERALQEGPGLGALTRHLDAFRLRPRPAGDTASGFEAARSAIRAARTELGEAAACEAFFEAERRYYARKNRAARCVKAQQDALGLGFANRDHHTYRSSRQGFQALVATLEALGLTCRERFYAGKDAGWGAQVMEHTETGICVFADVDLSPEEVTGDFAHQGLAPRDKLGTVGLWCELHGEAFLAAGMHHLECQFDFDAIARKLNAQGIDVMPRFTDYPHLKQAFTQGEIWRVASDRLEHARSAGFLSDAQAARIASDGALGSHFEILERNLGYKGFNQDGINKIILATDPRRADPSGG